MKYLVTGGLGFIGSHLVRNLLKEKNSKVLNIDRITEVSVPESLMNEKRNKNYFFKKMNICNFKELKKELIKFEPDIIFHLAAYSHVDNSIKAPELFIKNNILGSFNLFQISLDLMRIKKNFKIINVSTDEVYGSLSKRTRKFSESDKFIPSSPYSSSKASSDLIGMSFFKTFGLRIINTHCSNNFGPWQYPEKLIPKSIKSIILKKNIEIYGDGLNIRDWIFVEEHVRALNYISKHGVIGDSYNVGSNNEITNLKLIEKICDIYDILENPLHNSHSLIKFIKDRKGHDFRYGINNNKLKALGFKFNDNFEKNISTTIKWYIENKKWLLKKKLKY